MLKNKWILIIGIIFLSLGLLEIGARLVWPYDMTLRKIMQSSSNPRLLYELKPKAKIVFSGVFFKIPPTTLEISPQGIRDHGYSIKKPEGTYRIIILGDSVAFGWGVELEQTFSKKLERLLNKRGEKKYEVINFSVLTYNTVQEVETLAAKCLAFEPDLVIFVVLNNDKEPLTNYYYPFSFLKNTPDFFYKSHFFHGALGALGARMIKANSSDSKRGLAEAEAAIIRLKAIIGRNNFKVLFYRDKPWLRTILARHGLDNCIFDSRVDLNNQPWYRVSPKDRHPNGPGHGVMAQEILDFLNANHYLGPNQSAGLGLREVRRTDR